MFILHQTLEQNSIWLSDLQLCQLRLENNQSVPWLILVPKRPGIREIFELAEADRIQLLREITDISALLHNKLKPDKINVAALGNMVPQLHVHVIARYKTDAAWPHPVWGRVPSAAYTTEKLLQFRNKLGL